MAYVSKVKDTNENILDIKSRVTSAIFYGRCDSTSTATAFTATVDGLTLLYDGVSILLKNGVVTSKANFTININGLGAKPAYSNMAAATREETIFNVNYTMLFIYDETRVEGGCWICYRGYDSNSNDTGYYIRHSYAVLPVSDTARYYKLYFMSADSTQWVPASVHSANNATAARPVNQRPINPFGRIVYTTASTNFTAGTNLTVSSAWEQYRLTLGYSFNRIGAALTLTTKAPVYIKCAPQADGSAIIDEDVPYVQTLPTEADGKIYIFLGIADSATTIELFFDHPVYYHDGTKICLWSGKDLSNMATTQYVDDAIDALPEPMVFKGSLGTNGTITSLPTAAAANIGFTYKVITAGTYASQAADVGDTFISDGSSWILIPSGDDISSVIVTKVQTSGTKIATITVDSTSTDIYAPTPPSAATANPVMDGTAAIGTSSKYAKEDHVHPTDTSRQATLVSGTNIKTINNTSLLGSGNISTPNTTYAVATTAANGLMSSTDKSNLNSAYAHAVTNKGTSAAAGLYKIKTNSEGHVTGTTAVTKADITALGIPGTDTNTTYAAATTGAAGLMSSTDKAKLDSIASSATRNTFSSFAGAPTGNQTPSFGGTFNIYQVGQTTAGALTTTARTVTIPNSTATTAAAGLMPKISGSTAQMLNGAGSWVDIPASYWVYNSTNDTIELVFPS